jgi:hypothetical protein
MAAALRSGVPQIPIPVRGDQFHNAKMLVRLGCAPGIIKFKNLTEARLSTMINIVLADAPSQNGNTGTVATELRRSAIVCKERLDEEERENSVLKYAEIIESRALNASTRRMHTVDDSSRSVTMVYNPTLSAYHEPFRSPPASHAAKEEKQSHVQPRAGSDSIISLTTVNLGTSDNESNNAYSSRNSASNSSNNPANLQRHLPTILDNSVSVTMSLNDSNTAAVVNVVNSALVEPLTE